MRKTKKTLLLKDSEITRYTINGLIATFIHFSILTVNIEILHMGSAGFANFVAAIFGIITSFIGSRYYVYKDHTGSFLSHMTKFIVLYLSIAVLHGITLWVWTDIYHHTWIIGFLLATIIQVTMSYIGNKLLVFK